MALQGGAPWPMPADVMSPGRKRSRWPLVVAGVVVVGLVVGLVVWAPWRKVAVAPAAVHAQSPTATSVLVSWAPSKGGLAIDHYLVLRDGTQVGSVPASRTSYLDGGLVPGTGYRYTIIAVSGTQRSGPSVAADVTTITPSPVGLAVTRQTWTTLTFRWSPSPNGPVPDSYVVYSGANPIAVVPGTADSYSVTGLSPDTTHRYQVTARWGSHESAPSAALSVLTLTVPLQGSVPVQVDTLSTPGPGASLKPGQKWSDTWTFSAACSNRCTLTADGEFAAPGFSVKPFTMTLTSSGNGYAGSTEAKITECSSIHVQNTVSLSIAADKGAVDNGAWTSWTGTLLLSSPYTTAGGGYYCPSQSWDFRITGSNSGVSSGGTSATAETLARTASSDPSATTGTIYAYRQARTG